MARDNRAMPGQPQGSCPFKVVEASNIPSDPAEARARQADSQSSATGQLPFFLRKRLGYFTRGTFHYGDVLNVGWRSKSKLLTDPADTHHVLVRNSQFYTKGAKLSGVNGKLRAGRGLLTRSGDEHRERRRLLQPLFHQRNVDSYRGLIIQETQRMMSRWTPDQEVDISREMADLSCSILISTVFGFDWQNDRKKLADAIAARRRYTEYLYYSRLPFHDRLPTKTVRENQQAVETINQIVFDEIELRRKNLSEDLLSQLIAVRSPDGGCLTDQDVRDEVLTLTSAGHETTADTMSWTWYLIAKHGDVETEWRQELKQISTSDLTATEIATKLPYTRMILEESNRLYPPTWMYARVSLSEDKLPSGLQVTPGDTLLLCQYLMHRHSGFYPDPERFDPNRFRDAPSGSRLRQAYFPFGAGPHTCIGEVFSRMQSLLVLATVANRFRFELVPHHRVIPEPGVTLYPRNGVRVWAQAVSDES